MLPREPPRRQTSGRGNRGKSDRGASRQNAPVTRSTGNAPVMGTVIGFSPPTASSPTNDRLLFAFQVLIGYTVEVQVKAGSVYQGIFTTAQIENSELHVVLQMAKLIREAGSTATDSTVTRKPIKELIIRSADLVSLLAKDVRMGADDLSGPSEDSFSTDTAISRGRGGLAGRELQKWTPEASDDTSGMLLESEPHGKSSRWDQFAANQQLFGTDTSYNEDLYTTKLDASVSGITVEEAERLAAEIQRGVTSNRHMAEERGGGIDDSGMDEEDLYSAVGRQPGVDATTSGRQAAEEADAANAATFGGAGAGSAQRSSEAGPARTAWTGAGTSVAVVAGPNRSGVLERSSSSATGASQPIDMRAEHNKVRTQLQAGRQKDRSSPYGTPGAKSPLSSPLIADAAALEALNLNPGSVKFDSSTLRSFQEYKLKEAAKKAAQQRPAHISPSAVSMSTSETDLREEDSDIFMAGTPSKQSPGSSNSAAFASAASAPSHTAAAPAADAAPISDAAPSNAAPASAASPAPAEEASATGVPMPAAQPAPAIAAGTAVSESGSQARPASPSVKSKLNPFAREFKLNINAPSFTPAAKPAAASIPAAAPSPAAAVAPTSVASTSGQDEPQSAVNSGAATAPTPFQAPRHRATASNSMQSQGSTAGSLAEERQSRSTTASHAGSRGVSRHRPGSSPPGRRGVSPGGPSNRRTQYPPASEHMWSQGMQMPGHGPNMGGMPQGGPMQGSYIPSNMPGMLHGMPMMGSQQHMMNYMRPYNEPVPYGMMMPGQYGMVYGPPQINNPAQHMRPPAFSQGYHGQQVPLGQAMSGSLDSQNPTGQTHYYNGIKR